jgi:hypothetical protein
LMLGMQLLQPSTYSPHGVGRIWPGVKAIGYS